MKTLAEAQVLLTPEEQKWTKAQRIAAGVDLLIKRHPQWNRAVQIRGRLKGCGTMKPFKKDEVIFFYSSEKQAAGLA